MFETKKIMIALQFTAQCLLFRCRSRFLDLDNSGRIIENYSKPIMIDYITNTANDMEF